MSSKLATIAPSEDDRIYAAGFFDGEGSLGIYCRRGGRRRGCRETYLLTVSASQAVPTPIYWLQERWGGYVGLQIGRGPSRPVLTEGKWGISSSPMFVWSLAARRAMAFLIDIRPWLKVKGEQADIAIGFQQTRRWGGMGRGQAAEQRMLEHAAIGAAAKLQLVEVRHAALGR